MGPTAIIPKFHYYLIREVVHTENEIVLNCEAGTITIVWHCVTANLAAWKRFTMKFLFCRMEGL